MIAQIAALSDQIAERCNCCGVRGLEVFGSAATGDFDAQTSDGEAAA